MAEQDSEKEALLAANYIRLPFINSIKLHFSKITVYKQKRLNFNKANTQFNNHKR